jgi:hypothetical protein
VGLVDCRWNLDDCGATCRSIGRASNLSLLHCGRPPRSEIGEIRSERCDPSSKSRSDRDCLPAPRGPRAEGGGCRERGRNPQTRRIPRPSLATDTARVDDRGPRDGAEAISGSLAEAWCSSRRGQSLGDRGPGLALAVAMPAQGVQAQGEAEQVGLLGLGTHAVGPSPVQGSSRGG